MTTLRTLHPLTGLLALLALSLALPTLAVGQAEDSAADPARQRIRQTLIEAEGHRDAGRFALAAERYQAAYELMRAAALPRASVTLWDAGSALGELAGQEAEAIALLRRFLAESNGLADDEEVREEVRAQIRERRSSAVARIAELEARLPVAPEPHEELDTPPPSDTAEPTGGGISPIGPVVLGIGGAVFIAGLITSAVGLVQNQALIDRCPTLTGCDPAMQSEVDATRSLGLAGDVIWIVGATVALTGLVLTFTLEGDSGEEPAQVRLQGTPGGATLAFTGTFQ